MKDLLARSLDTLKFNSYKKKGLKTLHMSGFTVI